MFEVLIPLVIVVLMVLLLYKLPYGDGSCKKSSGDEKKWNKEL